MDETRVPNEDADPDALAPEAAAAEETVAAPEGAPSIVQIVGLAEEAEAFQGESGFEAVGDRVIERETAAVVEEAPMAPAVATVRLEK